MNLAQINASLTIRRAVRTRANGDPSEADTLVASTVPASIVQENSSVSSPTELGMAAVREISVIIDSGIDLQINDYIDVDLQEVDGTDVYWVQAVDPYRFHSRVARAVQVASDPIG